MKQAVLIARKEILDHLRDRRSMCSSGLMALLGPGVVLFVSLSKLSGGSERDALLLGMLSVFTLVVSFSGAADVAMDLAAGERERRSLVPLLLNPVSVREIALGKWMAVAVFALVSVALNTLGLVLVLFSAAPSVLGRQAGQLVAWIGLGLVPLALLGAATNILVAILCRTTKEANTASKMLVLVPMLVGMFLIFFPAWVGRVWFLLPIVGQQALIGFRDPAVPIIRTAVLALVTVFATGGALAAATHALRRNDVLSS